LKTIGEKFNQTPYSDQSTSDCKSERNEELKDLERRVDRRKVENDRKDDHEKSDGDFCETTRHSPLSKDTL
jgi:hypothetical protein